MPTLIMRPPQKQKSRPKAALYCPSSVQRFEYCLRRLALCSPTFFRSTSRASRVTRPAAHRAGLAALAAAIDVHQDVEGGEILRQLERLAHDHAAGLAPEELVHWL